MYTYIPTDLFTYHCSDLNIDWRFKLSYNDGKICTRNNPMYNTYIVMVHVVSSMMYVMYRVEDAILYMMYTIKSN